MVLTFGIYGSILCNRSTKYTCIQLYETKAFLWDESGETFFVFTRAVYERGDDGVLSESGGAPFMMRMDVQGVLQTGSDCIGSL